MVFVMVRVVSAYEVADDEPGPPRDGGPGCVGFCRIRSGGEDRPGTGGRRDPCLDSTRSPAGLRAGCRQKHVRTDIPEFRRRPPDDLRRLRPGRDPGARLRGHRIIQTSGPRAPRCLSRLPAERSRFRLRTVRVRSRAGPGRRDDRRATRWRTREPVRGRWRTPGMGAISRTTTRRGARRRTRRRSARDTSGRPGRSPRPARGSAPRPGRGTTSPRAAPGGGGPRAGRRCSRRSRWRRRRRRRWRR